MRNDDLIYDWLDLMAESKSANRRRIFKEEKIKDFVSGNTAKTAVAVGAIDKDFIKGSGDSIELDPHWKSQNIGSVTLHDGQNIQFNKKYAQALINTFHKACESTRTSKAGYFCPKHNGGFNSRTMRGRQGISNHSFGTAIDFLTLETQKEILNHPEFINTMKQGDGGIKFRWGGDFGAKYYDPMHFEVDFSGTVVTDENKPNTNINKADEEDEMGDNYSPGGLLGLAASALSGGGSSGLAGSYSPTANFATMFAGLEESKDIEKRLFIIKDQTNKKIYKKYKKYFDSLLKHLKKELKINKPVKIVLEEDEENAEKVLGRTGGYINHKIKIHIFCSQRHIKDIMRSLAHEMVHHHQNLRGEFDHNSKTTEGYAQSNKHLRKMEEEAYLRGNILFRDWEDNYKYRGEK
jgi:hypothetical protein